MVNYLALDDVFGALADKTRRAMISRLAGAERPVTISDLAAPFEMTLPAVMKHIAVLERAGMIRREKVGREVQCKLAGESLDQATGWLAEQRSFWEARLDSLGRYLESESRKESTDGRTNSDSE